MLYERIANSRSCRWNSFDTSRVMNGMEKRQNRHASRDGINAHRGCVCNHREIAVYNFYSSREITRIFDLRLSVLRPKKFSYASRHIFRDSPNIKVSFHLSVRDQQRSPGCISPRSVLHNHLAWSLRCPFLLSLRAKGREQLSAPRERTHSPYRKGCVRRARPASSLNPARVAANSCSHFARDHPSIFFSSFFFLSNARVHR